MSQGAKELYEFGPFRIDPDKETLLREGEPVPLTPKTFQILLVLVRHHEDPRLERGACGRDQGHPLDAARLRRRLAGHVVARDHAGSRQAAALCQRARDAQEPQLSSRHHAELAPPGITGEPGRRCGAGRTAATGSLPAPDANHEVRE